MARVDQSEAECRMVDTSLRNDDGWREIATVIDPNVQSSWPQVLGRRVNLP